MLVVGALLSVGLGPVAMAEPDDEDEYSTVDVLTCSTDGGGTEVQLNGVDGGSDGERYEWTLSRDGTVIRRDAFTYIDNDEDWDPGPAHLDGLTPGVYRLSYFRAGETVAVDQQDFEVLRCVTAISGCQNMTFTNPPENPALVIRYGAGEDDGSDDPVVADGGTITLAPGETRTVSTLREVAGWAASRWFSEDQPSSFGGEEWQFEVEQHCGDTMTRGRIACAPNRQSNGQVDLWFAPPEGRPVRYKVFDFHTVVDSGTVGGDRHLELRLPPSYYDLHVFTDRAELPYDRVFIEVPPCLRVTSTCQGLSLRTQTYWDTYDVSYRVDGGPAQKIRVRDDKAKQLSLPAGSVVTWHAATRHTETPEGWEANAGRGSAVAGVCGTDHGDLASTGAPRRSLGVVLVAGCLLLTGAAAVTRGGRSHV